MKVLVVGGGGREHALVWKILGDSEVSRVYVAPGNYGIFQESRVATVPIQANEIDKLLAFALKKNIDLTVVGPEAPLCAGIVDRFQEKGLKIFGPTQKAAEIEGSKVFAKEMMKKYNIPTAPFEVFGSHFQDDNEAVDFIKAHGAPIVVKADGLAAGKGVKVCKTVTEAIDFYESISIKKTLGKAGDKVIIEDCLEGEEASFVVFPVGEVVLPVLS